MANLDRILELAGLKDKSYYVKQLSEKTLEQLEHDKLCLEQQIKGASIVTEALAGIRLRLFQIEQAIIVAKEKVALTEASVRTTDSFEQGKVACANCNKSIHNDKTCTCNCHEENGLQKVEEEAAAVVEDTNIEEAKDAAALQASQPSAAQEKGDLDNLFNGHDEEKADAEKLHQDAQGITQDRETKVSVPRDVFSQIDQRIKELKQSIELYDKTTYKMQYDNKQKAIENLEFIREKLKMGNMEGYKQAQIHYTTLASIYAGNLFPAKLVDFLHDGQASEKREVAFGDAFKGNPDKPTEGEVPGNAIYKTLNTSIYPQKGEDNVPKE